MHNILTENDLLIECWGQPSLNTDINNSIQIDEKKGDKPGTFISGVFMQAEKINGNGRIYPKHVLEHAVNEYINTQVNKNQALGELNHPTRSTPDPKEAAIIIEELYFAGNDVMGRARVLDTPNGKIVKSLIEGGWVPGVSSRGLGRVKSVNGINEVQDGFKLTVGVDVVWGPSAPEAYVDAYTNEAVKEELNNNVAFTSLTEKLKSLL